MSSFVQEVPYKMRVINGYERPDRHWRRFSSIELQTYCIKNIGKTDCSFAVIDPIKQGNDKILRSFRWIISDMSPVLKTFFDDEKYRANNFELIPIYDSNFEAIISYGHTKALNDWTFDSLLYLFEKSRQYQITNFKVEVLKMFNKNKYTTVKWWIELFIIIYQQGENSGDVDQIIAEMDTDKMETVLRSNFEMVLDFSENQFCAFLDLIQKRSLKSTICFELTEAYVLKHIFKNDMPTSTEEHENLTRDIISYFFEKIKFRPTDDDSKNISVLIKDSKVLDNKLKEHFLKTVKTYS